MAEHKSINQPNTTTCTLDEKVQNLLTTILHVNLMNSVVNETKFDSTQGHLTKANIIAGYKGLREIQSLVMAGGNDMQSLLKASYDYYLNIPHNFGTTNVPTVIQSLDRIQEECQLLKILSDIRIALDLIMNFDINVHPLDRFYQLLNCNITPISSESDDYQMVNKKVTESPESTQYSMTILELYGLRRDSEWNNFKDYGNTMFLWHRSRTIIYGAILQHGLTITPSKAPIPGHLLHRGLHFGDVCSNSARNVFPTLYNNTGFLLLCEVSLGDIYEPSNLNNKPEKLPKGCNSLRVRGDVMVPLGPPLYSNFNSTEYIVYNTNQIKLRYLVKVEFRFKN